MLREILNQQQWEQFSWLTNINQQLKAPSAYGLLSPSLIVSPRASELVRKPSQDHVTLWIRRTFSAGMSPSATSECVLHLQKPETGRLMCEGQTDARWMRKSTARPARENHTAALRETNTNIFNYIKLSTNAIELEGQQILVACKRATLHKSHMRKIRGRW